MGSRGAGAACGAAVLLSVVVLFLPGSGGALPFPQADKLVHAALFGLLAATARWRFGDGPGPAARPARRPSGTPGPGRPLPAALVAVCAYAPVSEILQYAVVPGRSGDVLDAVADLLGAALGWRLGRVLAARTPSAA